jgi:hypothetical protein
LPGTALSFEVASVQEESVSMSAVLRGGEKVSGDDLLRGCLRLSTFRSALPLSLKFQRFCWWQAASASVFLGNRPPALIVALWLLVN